MYEEYFGLERPPFKITPDTSLFFEGGKRGDILAALVYAVHRGEGIIKVMGEVGSGKTMLCRMLQLRLPATVEIVYIANPSVSAEDILFVVAHELSLPVDRDASKHQVIRLLQDYLLQRHMENKQVVLFIEEAQGMPLDTLEEIRLLSNLETDENKLLQIILFGQPELDQNLSVRSIRQLRERITHNFELEPLTQEEIYNYLNFRMRQVGYTGPELISNNLARKIEKHSEGLLRRINIIGDKILLSAFAEGTHNLVPKHVTAAVNDSAFAQEAPHRSSSLLRWGLVGLLVGAGALAKYTNLALIVSFLLFCLSSRPDRKHLLRPTFWVLVAMALLCMAPVVIWNAQRDWITVRHLVERGELTEGWQFRPDEFLEYVGQQFGVAFPLYLVGMFVAFIAPDIRRHFTTAYRFLLCMSAPLYLFYTFLALNDKGQPNWTVPSLVGGLVIMTAYWLRRSDESRSWRRTATVTLCLAGLVVVGFLVSTRFRMPTRRDPLVRARGSRDLAAQVVAQADEHTADFILGANYQVASLLTFYLPDHPAVYPPHSKPT